MRKAEARESIPPTATREVPEGSDHPALPRPSVSLSTTLPRNALNLNEWVVAAAKIADARRRREAATRLAEEKKESGRVRIVEANHLYPSPEESLRSVPVAFRNAVLGIAPDGSGHGESDNLCSFEYPFSVGTEQDSSCDELQLRDESDKHSNAPDHACRPRRGPEHQYLYPQNKQDALAEGFLGLPTLCAYVEGLSRLLGPWLLALVVLMTAVVATASSMCFYCAPPDGEEGSETTNRSTTSAGKISSFFAFLIRPLPNLTASTGQQSTSTQDLFASLGFPGPGTQLPADAFSFPSKILNVPASRLFCTFTAWLWSSTCSFSISLFALLFVGLSIALLYISERWLSGPPIYSIWPQEDERIRNSPTLAACKSAGLWYCGMPLVSSSSTTASAQPKTQDRAAEEAANRCASLVTRGRERERKMDISGLYGGVRTLLRNVTSVSRQLQLFMRRKLLPREDFRMTAATSNPGHDAGSSNPHSSSRSTHPHSVNGNNSVASMPPSSGQEGRCCSISSKDEVAQRMMSTSARTFDGENLSSGLYADVDVASAISSASSSSSTRATGDDTGSKTVSESSHDSSWSRLLGSRTGSRSGVTGDPRRSRMTEEKDGSSSSSSLIRAAASNMSSSSAVADGPRPPPNTKTTTYPKPNQQSRNIRAQIASVIRNWRVPDYAKDYEPWWVKWVYRLFPGAHTGDVCSIVPYLCYPQTPMTYDARVWVRVPAEPTRQKLKSSNRSRGAVPEGHGQQHAAPAEAEHLHDGVPPSAPEEALSIDFMFPPEYSGFLSEVEEEDHGGGQPQCPYDLHQNDDVETRKNERNKARNDKELPLLIILHGLNGGSQEPYVQDVMQHFVFNRGFAVCCLAARGLGGSKLSNSTSMWHACRWQDCRSGILQCLKLWKRAGYDHKNVYAVGISMGGIMLSQMLNNLKAASLSSSSEGDLHRLKLKGAICVSGQVYSLASLVAQRPQRVWHPLLVVGLKETFGKWWWRIAEKADRGGGLEVEPEDEQSSWSDAMNSQPEEVEQEEDPQEGRPGLVPRKAGQEETIRMSDVPSHLLPENLDREEAAREKRALLHFPSEAYLRKTLPSRKSCSADELCWPADDEPNEGDPQLVEDVFKHRLHLVRSHTIAQFDLFARGRFFAPKNAPRLQGVANYYALQHTQAENIQMCPTLYLHAADDPVCSSWGFADCIESTRTAGAAGTAMSDHKAIFLFTRTGGHVGWPTWRLNEPDRWRYMKDVIGSFIDACGYVAEDDEEDPVLGLGVAGERI